MPAQRRKVRNRQGAAPIAVVVVLGLLGAVSAAAAAERKPPHAVLADAERKLGVLAPGESATATFRVQNDGGAPLTIKAGTPTPFVPGVHVDVKGAPVPPGKAASVTVTMDTAGLSGPGTLRVPLTTNDPAAEQLAVGLTVEVKPLLVADPGFARYTVVQHEREGTIAQTVWSLDGAQFRVLKVESPNDHLRVSFREATAAERTDAPGSQWRVESVLAEDAPVGALAGNIVVVTDHARQSKLRIALSGFVRPVFAVTPPVAELGEVDGAKPFRFTLDVKNFASEAIALDGAECDLAGATTEILPVTPGHGYKVRVSVPAGLPAGALAGTVRIRTASAKMPLLEVPVRGRLREAAAPADGN